MNRDDMPDIFKKILDLHINGDLDFERIMELLDSFEQSSGIRGVHITGERITFFGPAPEEDMSAFNSRAGSSMSYSKVNNPLVSHFEVIPREKDYLLVADLRNHYIPGCDLEVKPSYGSVGLEMACDDTIVRQNLDLRQLPDGYYDGLLEVKEKRFNNGVLEMLVSKV